MLTWLAPPSFPHCSAVAVRGRRHQPGGGQGAACLLCLMYNALASCKLNRTAISSTKCTRCPMLHLSMTPRLCAITSHLTCAMACNTPPAPHICPAAGACAPGRLCPHIPSSGGRAGHQFPRGPARPAGPPASRGARAAAAGADMSSSPYALWIQLTRSGSSRCGSCNHPCAATSGPVAGRHCSCHAMLSLPFGQHTACPILQAGTPPVHMPSRYTHARCSVEPSPERFDACLLTPCSCQVPPSLSCSP